MPKKPESKKVSRRALSKMPREYPDIAQRFQQFKDETGLTFKDLADATGTSLQSLQAYAAGRVSPNFSTLRTLKKKFGLSYDWLIDGDVVKKAPKPSIKMIAELKRLIEKWESE